MALAAQVRFAVINYGTDELEDMLAQLGEDALAKGNLRGWALGRWWPSVWDTPPIVYELLDAVKAGGECCFHPARPARKGDSPFAESVTRGVVDVEEEQPHGSLKLLLRRVSTMFHVLSCAGG